MSQSNEYGQGASHATKPSDSKVPYKVQEFAPKGLEQGLPDSVHPTKGENSVGMGQSHATGKSIVPEGIQKLAPEALERALPDSIHDTSGGGKHSLEKEAKKHL